MDHELVVGQKEMKMGWFVMICAYTHNAGNGKERRCEVRKESAVRDLEVQDADADADAEYDPDIRLWLRTLVHV